MQMILFFLLNLQSVFVFMGCQSIITRRRCLYTSLYGWNIQLDMAVDLHPLLSLERHRCEHVCSVHRMYSAVHALYPEKPSHMSLYRGDQHTLIHTHSWHCRVAIIHCAYMASLGCAVI